MWVHCLPFISGVRAEGVRRPGGQAVGKGVGALYHGSRHGVWVVHGLGMQTWGLLLLLVLAHRCFHTLSRGASAAGWLERKEREVSS
jgi:hypothetical protein